MMTEKWHTASLRVTSKELSLFEIENLLGAAPDVGRDLGSPVRPEMPESPTREHSVWVLKSGLDESVPLEQHLAKLMSFVESHSDQIIELNSKAEIEFFCGFSSESGQGSLELSPSLIKEIAAFSIWIVLDLYPPEHFDVE
jgi:hypothetical protein